jgi:hypothetical protein
MGFLVEPITDSVDYAGRRYRVNSAFDTVLEIQRLYREEELSDVDKVNQALRMLLVRERSMNRLNILERSELLNEIYKQCVNTRKHPPTGQKLPCLDFEYDGDYIFASFMLDYGIDLIEQQGILPWKKFLALFQGLSEKSKIREVMRIRNMDVPEYNGKNTKEIQQIQELKSFYALPVRGGGGKQGLDLLFSTLEGMAVRTNG